MATPLQDLAAEIVRRNPGVTEDGDPMKFVGAVVALQEVHGSTLELRHYATEIRNALALAQKFDPAPFLADSHTVGRNNTWWRYRFPNGREASVIPDPLRPFHFEIASDVYEQGGVKPALTTEQVGHELSRIHDMPPADDTCDTCGKSIHVCIYTGDHNDEEN